MFKESRRKIILSIMAALILVLAGTLGIIYGSSLYEMSGTNREMLERYVELYSLEQQPGDDKRRGNRPGPDADAERAEASPAFRLSTFYSVAVSDTGEILATDNDGPTVYNDEELITIAESVLNKGRESGIIDSLIYRAADKDGYTLIAFMDNTIQQEGVSTLFHGGLPDDESGIPDGMVTGDGAPDSASIGNNLPDGELPDGEPPDDLDSNEMLVGTPDGGTTQSATGSMDSANYDSYEDMVAAYRSDIEEIYAGDEYGNNIVSLYNPLNYIGAEDTENPTWTKIIMGASEGDMSLFSSLNLQMAWLNAGVDAVIEWQWNGGHVPSEILGNSFSLYVDQMYGEYVDSAVTVTKAAATPQAENGTAEEATGTDLSGWVNAEDVTSVSFSLADAVVYRTSGASKAMPGFDVIDYGQEDYVFGSSEVDARHWDKFLLEIFEEHADVLEPLFNSNWP